MKIVAETKESCRQLEVLGRECVICIRERTEDNE